MRGDRAMVWIWDEAERLEQVAAIAEKYQQFQESVGELEPLPETALAPLGSDSVAYHRCAVGVEKLVWRNSYLESSIWSRSKDCGEAKNSEVTPWTHSKTHFSELSESFLWRLGLAALVMVLIFEIGVLSGVWWQQYVAGRDLDVEREKLSTTLAVREKVRSMQSEVARLEGWLKNPTQLELLAAFSKKLPETASIEEWSYGDNLLKVTVADEALDNRAYVESFSAVSMFSRVRIEPGIKSNTAIITLKVGSR